MPEEVVDVAALLGGGDSDVVDVSALLGTAQPPRPAAPAPSAYQPPRPTGVGPAILRQLTGMESISEASLEEFDQAHPKPKSVKDFALQQLQMNPVTAPAFMAVGEGKRILEQLRKVGTRKHFDENLTEAVGALPLVGHGAKSAIETIGRDDWTGGLTEATIAALGVTGLLKGVGSVQETIALRRATRAAEEAARMKAAASFKPVEQPLAIDPAAPPTELPLDVAAALNEQPKPQVFAGETGPALRAAEVPAPEVGPANPPMPRQPRPSMDSGLPEVSEPGKPIRFSTGPREGRWFSTILEDAAGYARAQQGQVGYIDVPAEAVARGSERGFGDGQYLVMAKDEAKNVRLLDQENPPPVPEGMVRVYRGMSPAEAASGEITIPVEPLGPQVGGAVPPALETGQRINVPRDVTPVGVTSPETAAAYQAALDQIKAFANEVTRGVPSVPALLEKYGLPPTTRTSREAAQILADRARAIRDNATPAPGVAEVSPDGFIPGNETIPPDVFAPPAEIPNTLRQPPTFQMPKGPAPRPAPVPVDPSVSSIPLAPEAPPPPKPVVRSESTGIGQANEGISGSSISQPAKELPLSRLQHAEEFKLDLNPDGSPSYGGDLGSAVSKLLVGVRSASKASREAKRLYAIERGKRSARAMTKMTEVGGEAGIQAARGELAGELPKPVFEPIGGQFSKRERAAMYDEITRSPNLEPFERIRAGHALNTVLDGGAVPQPKETALLGKVFGPDVVEAINARAYTWTKNWLVSVYNFPRTLLSGPDLSYVMRQTKLMVSSPRMLRATFTPYVRPETGTRGNLWTMHRAFFEGISKDPSKAFVAKATEIAHRPNAPLYKLSGVDFTVKSELGGLASAEESFLKNNWATKIPALGRLYKASEEAALTFVNGMRADAYDALARPYLRKGMTYETHPEVFNAIGEWVNITSGRGNLGALENSASLLASGLFAPRLLKANLDILNPYTYVKLWKADPALAWRAMTDLTAYVASRATAVYLAGLAGADVGEDPRSAEFGKVRVGRARLDLWGGEMQVARLGMQLVTGEKTQLTGERVPVDKGDVILEFLKQRRHPTLVYAWNQMRQKGDRGEPIDQAKEAARILTGLPMQDLFTLAKEQPDALWMIFPGSYGGSITAYDPPTKLTDEDRRALRATEAAAKVRRDLGRQLDAVRPPTHEQSAQEREMFVTREAQRRQIELELWGLISDKSYAKARATARKANEKYNFGFKIDQMIDSKRRLSPTGAGQ